MMLQLKIKHDIWRRKLPTLGLGKFHGKGPKRTLPLQRGRCLLSCTFLKRSVVESKRKTQECETLRSHVSSAKCGVVPRRTSAILTSSARQRNVRSTRLLSQSGVSKMRHQKKPRKQNLKPNERPRLSKLHTRTLPRQVQSAIRDRGRTHFQATCSMTLTHHRIRHTTWVDQYRITTCHITARCIKLNILQTPITSPDRAPSIWFSDLMECHRALCTTMDLLLRDTPNMLPDITSSPLNTAMIRNENHSLIILDGPCTWQLTPILVPNLRD
mmetsp:Transcript_26413/g.47897  ORF Transcript_26413/g.47897 Transcript_26413/m.47897 type:complete len:271 (+) Transcript_26413:301-1113(+)